MGTGCHDRPAAPLYIARSSALIEHGLEPTHRRGQPTRDLIPTHQRESRARVSPFLPRHRASCFHPPLESDMTGMLYYYKTRRGGEEAFQGLESGQDAQAPAPAPASAPAPACSKPARDSRRERRNIRERTYLPGIATLQRDMTSPSDKPWARRCTRTRDCLPLEQSSISLSPGTFCTSVHESMPLAGPSGGTAALVWTISILLKQCVLLSRSSREDPPCAGDEHRHHRQSTALVRNPAIPRAATRAIARAG